MSMEATWDLQANYSPRSLAVYPAGETLPQSTNPFEAGSSSSGDNAIACVYGTERGSLHYRTFAPPNRTSRGGLSSPARSSSAAAKLQVPLGVQQSRATNVPRGYFPVDLGSSSLPGSIVSCIRLGHKHVFLLLVDDNRGTSASQPGAYAAHLVTLHHGNFHVLTTSSNNPLPRMSCAVYHPTTGLVYAAGRSIHSLSPEQWEDEPKRRRTSKRVTFQKTTLPSPGVRSGQDGLTITSSGNVAIAAVGNSFYAIPGTEEDEVPEAVKILSFAQSSQVHPVICLDVQDQSLEPDWSCLFLASGRDCAVVDLCFGPPATPRISCSKPRNESVTLASPILAAAASWPWVVILTSDGLISIRSPSCMAVPLRTVEVGTRPNDYFVLRTVQHETQAAPWIVAIAYSGEGRVLQCQPDTAQDLADRLMRHAIDAFGANGFPRSELAEAVNASFTATSYVGPEPTAHARTLLKQYLEAVLGLADFEGGGSSGWPTELSAEEGHHGTFKTKSGTLGRGAPPTVVSSSSPAALLTGTALLCLVCGQMSPPSSGLASRAAKACAEKMGVVTEDSLSAPAVKVCELVADKLLRESSQAFSLLTGSPPGRTRIQRQSQAHTATDFVEAAIWLLRSCGKHERAIDVAYERLQQQGKTSQEGAVNTRGFWSQIKYESYTATHLSELWGAGKEEGCRLVLRSPATHRLLENNPRLGLSVFTAMYPQNESQWQSMLARDDPLGHPDLAFLVVKLLKSINPAVPYDKERALASEEEDALPLESGRALAVTYLEAAIGIATGRPTELDEFDSLPPDENFEERVANFHDELSFLLLEGVISERRDDEDDSDTPLGKVYRNKLRRLLRWPLAKIRPDNFMNSLPSSFLQEKALVLGRLGRHEDALRILYQDLNSLDLALEYCDDRHERQKVIEERSRARQQQNMFADQEQEMQEEDNAYLPLIRVALESDSEKGTACAIQVLALRRSAIDRAAALRLLPADVPVSAVARPFLIPALVDSESQVRRLTVVSALLRARYLRLKDQLTTAQLKAQANLHVVPQLRSLNLGDPLHSTKPFKARTSAAAGITMPDVMIVKHFFSNHLVIQAKVTNTIANNGRTLSDIAFVVAESSEEAIQPLLQVPVQVLPPNMTGSAWCVLTASPGRMDGSIAALTCELRYTVQSVDAAGSNAMMSPGAAGRTYVEELQDLEVHAAHFT